MKFMTKWMTALLFAGMAATAVAQEYPTEPYDFILAKLASNEGRYDDALTLLDKVLQKNPDNAVLQYEHAMVQIEASRLDRAESELRAVVTAHPDFFDAQRILGRLLLDRAGSDKTKLDDALVHLQAAYKINPDDIVTGTAVSQLLVAVGRTADAERVVATLLERAPDQRGLNYNYAQILTKLGRGDESKQYLERAVLLDPTFGQAVLQLLDLYQKENEWQKAAQLLQPLIDEDPVNVELQRQQAYFWLRAGEPEKARARFKALTDADPKDTRSLFYLAESLNDLEQYDAADRLYRSLLERTPDDPDLLASFGLSQIGQKKYDDAAKTFQRLLATKDVPPNLAVLAQTQLGLIALQQGRNAEAIATARKVLVYGDRPNPQAINIALDALRKDKKYGDAVLLLKPLVDSYAADPYVNARYIEMLIRNGEKDKAHAAASTQVKFGPRNTIAAAEAFIQAQEFPPALVLLNEAVRTRPDDIDLRFELGSAYDRAGDHAAAEKSFLELLQKTPEHAPTLNYLGYMWAESGTNLDRAVEMLKRAVAQEPANGAYVDSLGWAYFRQGKLDLAEKLLTDATKLLPRDPTVQQHLGDVLARRGQLVRALDVYRAALKLDPEAKDESSLRSKIAQLEKQSSETQPR
jgi:tetratricopeptide (TPR) repeat protein